MYVDADVLYAYLKPTDWLKSFSQRILAKKVITSSATIMELEFVARRDFGEEFADQILERVKEIKNITLVDLNPEILEMSVKIRKEYKLNIFDAVHVATAIVHKEDIVSSDLMFERVKEVKRIDPREFKE